MKIKLEFIAIAFGILLLANTNVRSQGFRELKIGDKLPDLPDFEVINHSKKTVSLSSSKGKYLIIDFWNTGCYPCLRTMEKIEKYKGKYNKDVQFMPVTEEAGEKPKQSLNALKINTPSVINDTVLRQLFPHVGVPYYVWIDRDGIITNFTASDEVTEENIQRLVKGEKLKLKQRPTFIVKKNEIVPLNVNNLVLPENSETIFTSRLTKYDEKFRFGGWIFLKDRMLASRLRPSNLLAISYGISVNKLIDETKKRELFEFGNNWSNVFNYSCHFPEGVTLDSLTAMNKMLKYMQFDMQKFFLVKAGIEKRKMNCLILRRKFGFDPQDLFYKQKVTSGNQKNIFQPKNKVDFMNNLSFYMSKYIEFIDEANLNLPMDLAIEPNWNDFKSVKQAFLKIGLDISEEEREVEVLVIRDI